MHRLAIHHTGGLQFERTATLVLDGAETVDGVTQRVNHATEVAVADGDRKNLTRAGDLHALDDAGEVTQHNNTDFVLIEVEGQTQGAVGETNELVCHDAGQSFDVRNSVSGVDDVTHLSLGCAARLVRGHEVLEGIANLVRADRDICHCPWVPFLDECPGASGLVKRGRRALAHQLTPQFIEARRYGAIHHVVTHLDSNTTDDRLVDLGVDKHVASVRRAEAFCH